MTLTSDIITAAYRESKFKGQGQTLTALEQSEGLAMLQSLVDSFFGLVVGTKAKPWWVPFKFNTAPEAQNFPAAPGNDTLRRGTDINYPPPNSRVFLRMGALAVRAGFAVSCSHETPNEMRPRGAGFGRRRCRSTSAGFGDRVHERPGRRGQR